MMTGQKIADLRTQANLTQEQLADKLYITRELVSKWETGKRRPSYSTVLKLSEIFSVDPEDILNRNEAFLDELSECIPDKRCENAETLMTDFNAFLSTLNERDRSVFLRRYYFMDESLAIAENYGIKESHVRTILMRTRKKLTKYFKEAL